MSRRLPPLNALRAFEAAARHLSFTKAAQELHVTPAAVSHQVKALEDFYGVCLFRRLTRALLLTDAGQAILPPLREGFDRLAEAAERLRAEEAGGTLMVSVGPSFAAKWLVPRLERFARAYPQFDVRIDATDELANFTRDGVHVALRYGAGHYSGLRAERLFAEESFPVCSPALIDGPNPLCVPEDLSRHTLLHVDWRMEDATSPNWRMWLLAAGVPGVDAERGPRFSMDSLAVQAAIEGHGVALVADVLVADDLAAGRLVRPFELSVTGTLGFAYYVVYPEASAQMPKIAAFRTWALAEAGAPEAPGIPAG